jgi:hypothetical protein
MRRYFSVPKITSETCPCDNTDELDFMREIVDNFKTLVTHYPEGFYPVTIKVDLKFEAPAVVTEKIVLSLQGTVIYIYTKMFKEPYPSAPFTELQRQRINAIWKGIGHPENIIAS